MHPKFLDALRRASRTRRESLGETVENALKYSGIVQVDIPAGVQGKRGPKAKSKNRNEETDEKT